MTKSAFIKARVEPALKEEAENVLYELGIPPLRRQLQCYINMWHVNINGLLQ